ncbi:MAG: WecB/TagA/CpsF family glycosyltransferase [Algoriphagus sp.]|uniref:WecB/TagA/CpsF family glycosyltransferase n=1 Tax=Algoriphagus sp. TaxID=1872435 RepID=UPI0017BCDADE|nr:WecB/TagA/CpsF family glycosyltransferase [Algoriphagus sp.]NVJ86754.1 WecB/TagA/CpsF family glycosyltransferase [Algoriphagus sp.]
MGFVQGQNKILVAVNAEKIRNADPELKEVINQNVGYPDGVGAVWALRQKGLSNVAKIPGVELWLEFVRKYHQEKRFFFIGAREEIIQATIDRLYSKFPGLNLVGFRNGYITPDQEEGVIEMVSEKKPDFVFVAMGSPAQERLMTKLSEKHPAIYIGLGGSFDIYSGRTKRAPEWMIDMKLEWFYRLVTEPKRIGRQLKLIGFVKNMIFKNY